ncbi:hypothetical protein HNQ79_006382 [Streptomyces candidus]|uniref:Uncharacterized protein n=1 Tax=Streptomyces candidus TaxID=67283 RepID=A0A7X0HLH2_9ACTN|nr:hypothetical protein [Streptomyces candidus]
MACTRGQTPQYLFTAGALFAELVRCRCKQPAHTSATLWPPL